MTIKKEKITTENVFEQMALMTKQTLIKQGILPNHANDLAIGFVKSHGEEILTDLVRKEVDKGK